MLRAPRLYLSKLLWPHEDSWDIIGTCGGDFILSPHDSYCRYDSWGLSRKLKPECKATGASFSSRRYSTHLPLTRHLGMGEQRDTHPGNTVSESALMRCPSRTCRAQG